MGPLIFGVVVVFKRQVFAGPNGRHGFLIRPETERTGHGGLSSIPLPNTSALSPLLYSHQHTYRAPCACADGGGETAPAHFVFDI